MEISIHALREEGDERPKPQSGMDENFYPRPPRGGRRAKTTTTHGARVFLSTPSARRATDYRLVRLAKFDISIHALREEGDLGQYEAG